MGEGSNLEDGRVGCVRALMLVSSRLTGRPIVNAVTALRDAVQILLSSQVGYMSQQLFCFLVMLLL